MKLDKVVFYGIFTIIIILLLVNARVGDLRQKFDTYCVKEYNINDSCPCINTKLQSGFDNIEELDNFSQKFPDK